MRNKDERTSFMAEAEKLKSLGFDVYVASDPLSCYGYFVEGENFAYFQKDQYGGLEFSTEHKPTPKWGSGFAVHMGINPTKDDLRRAFFTPSWWEGAVVSVTQYANFDEFLKRSRYLELIKL